jgi:hypothetical protein
MNPAFWKRHRHPTTKKRISRTKTGARHPTQSSHPPPSKHPAQHPQPIPGNRRYQIHRRFHLDLPIPAVGLEAEEANVGRVDGVLVVNPDEAEGFEGGEQFSQGSHVDERRSSAQADFGSPPVATRQ